ncbi:MAG: imidazole glycerol phosphate synthase subunit HisH [Devosiaceae bacterium]|nr:imidazole glycerol phosphate synthase subunit HisH [Devosiaceae bacterium]
MTIAVIDYGIGNVQSVVNACARLGQDVERVPNGADLLDLHPEKIIMPGVGAIGAALARMRKMDFETALEDLVRKQNIPFLGICVGMQMLSETCEEFGVHQGLGWIPGRVQKFDLEDEIRVPHVGWNTILRPDFDDPVLASFYGNDFYFLHSCKMETSPEFVAARTDYGGEFVSAVRRDNILGVQFHPEKSSSAGAGLIRQFVGAG